MLKISIILVTWNGKKYIPYCLESIFDQSFQDFKVLIIDNGSIDDTVEYIKSNYNLYLTNEKLKLIENKENTGFCGGYNQAIREVIKDSEYILMLNQDIVLEKNYLEEIVNFLKTHQKIGALMGKIYRWDFEKNKKTNIIDSAGIKMFRNRRAVEIGQGEEDKGQFNKTKEIFGVTGACSIFNSQALKDVEIKLSNKMPEYLDEDFVAYKEDIDISLRLRAYGWKIFFLPQAKAYHDRTLRGEKNLNDVSVALNRKNKNKWRNFLSYKNHLFMLIKNEFLKNFILDFPWIAFYELKKIVFMLIFEFPTLKEALWNFFKQLPLIFKKRKIIASRRKINAKEIRKWIS